MSLVIFINSDYLYLEVNIVTVCSIDSRTVTKFDEFPSRRMYIDYFNNMFDDDTMITNDTIIINYRTIAQETSRVIKLHRTSG